MHQAIEQIEAFEYADAASILESAVEEAIAELGPFHATVAALYLQQGLLKHLNNAEDWDSSVYDRALSIAGRTAEAAPYMVPALCALISLYDQQGMIRKSNWYMERLSQHLFEQNRPLPRNPVR